MAIPAELAKAQRTGRLIPFVGAGVSRAVQSNLFPSWKDLLQKLAVRLEAEQDPDSALIVRAQCRKGQLLKAAEEAIAALGLNRFHQVLRDCFPRRCPTDADLTLPRAIWQLRPPIVITTNYDAVLQWAHPEVRRVLNHQCAELAELFATASAAEPLVWHLHGCLEEADSLILGPSQYARLYQGQAGRLEDYAAALLQLKQAAVNHTFLFLGFGLRDPYVVDQLKEVFAVFRGTSRPHFAMLRTGEADAAALWSECNVQVVDFADFGPPLLELLSQLAAERQPPHPDGPAPAASGAVRVNPPAVPATYRPWLQRECSSVELLGLEDQQGRSVQLYQAGSRPRAPEV